MATEGPMMVDGGQNNAAVDLSASQFCAVKITGSRTANLASTGGEFIHGILQNKPKAGAPINACFSGICKAKAGATFAAGAFLMTDTSARLILATTGNAVVAQALEASSAANAIVSVRVLDGGRPI
jgi:hypothetical protein